MPKYLTLLVLGLFTSLLGYFIPVQFLLVKSFVFVVGIAFAIGSVWYAVKVVNGNTSNKLNPLVFVLILGSTLVILFWLLTIDV